MNNCDALRLLHDGKIINVGEKFSSHPNLLGGILVIQHSKSAYRNMLREILVLSRNRKLEVRFRNDTPAQEKDYS